MRCIQLDDFYAPMQALHSTGLRESQKVNHQRHETLSLGMPESYLDQYVKLKTKNPPLLEGRRCSPVGCFLEATSAFAIHLAGVGRLAWASTQFKMLINDITEILIPTGSKYISQAHTMSLPPCTMSRRLVFVWRNCRGALRDITSSMKKSKALRIRAPTRGRKMTPTPSR